MECDWLMALAISLLVILGIVLAVLSYDQLFGLSYAFLLRKNTT